MIKGLWVQCPCILVIKRALGSVSVYSCDKKGFGFSVRVFL